MLRQRQASVVHVYAFPRSESSEDTADSVRMKKRESDEAFHVHIILVTVYVSIISSSGSRFCDLLREGGMVGLVDRLWQSG